MSGQKVHWSRKGGSASAITSRRRGGTWLWLAIHYHTSGGGVETVETLAGRGGRARLAGRLANESAAMGLRAARASTSSAGSTCSSTAPPVWNRSTGAVTAASCAATST